MGLITLVSLCCNWRLKRYWPALKHMQNRSKKKVYKLKTCHCRRVGSIVDVVMKGGLVGGVINLS